MQIITLRSHVGEDGIMHLQVPVGKIDVDLEGEHPTWAEILDCE